MFSSLIELTVLVPQFYPIDLQHCNTYLSIILIILDGLVSVDLLVKYVIGNKSFF